MATNPIVKKLINQAIGKAGAAGMVAGKEGPAYYYGLREGLKQNLPKTGTQAEMARDFIANAEANKATESPAFKRTIQAIGKQFGPNAGAATVGPVIGIGATAAAGALGAVAIARAGNKLNKQVKAYGEDTIKRQDELLAAAKAQRPRMQAKRKADEAYAKKKFGTDIGAGWGP